MRARTEFGSAEVLERWVSRFHRSETILSLDSQTRDPIYCDRLPVDYPCQDRIRRLDVYKSDKYFEAYFPGECDSFKLLQSRFSSSPTFSRTQGQFKPSVWAAWAEAKYASSALPNSPSDKYDWDDTLSTCDQIVSSVLLSDAPGPYIPDNQLLIMAPSYSKPSRHCSICNSSLISALAVVKPPGYCEYSGEMICGNCFDVREVVVPWKVVQGFETFRGNVSRKSAQIIHANFYAASIPYSQLSALPCIRTTQSIRIRCQTFRPKILFCDRLRENVLQVIASLPAHFRDEISGNESQSCLYYCLADLVDIVGGSSIIGRTLMLCLDVLESHNCDDCERKFSSICVVCTHKVSCTDIEWTYCDDCDSWFHRTCHSRCIGGCPVCANRLPLHANFSLDDTSDLVVSL